MHPSHSVSPTAMELGPKNAITAQNPKETQDSQSSTKKRVMFSIFLTPPPNKRKWVLGGKSPRGSQPKAHWRIFLLDTINSLQGVWIASKGRSCGVVLPFTQACRVLIQYQAAFLVGGWVGHRFGVWLGYLAQADGGHMQSTKSSNPKHVLKHCPACLLRNLQVNSFASIEISKPKFPTSVRVTTCDDGSGASNGQSQSTHFRRIVPEILWQIAWISKEPCFKNCFLYPMKFYTPVIIPPTVPSPTSFHSWYVQVLLFDQEALYVPHMSDEGAYSCITEGVGVNKAVLGDPYFFFFFFKERP